jgi:hypothetical protein
MIRFAFLAAAGLAIALAACTPKPPEAPAAAGPATLKDLEAAHDWQHEPGDKVNAAWNDGVKKILGKRSRPEAIAAIEAAGFSCIYGEAHETYPDPMAVCTRSFATRACQMDWEISSTAEKAMVDEVDGTFKRDCVGTADDWPDKVESAIDNQLAPQTPPAPATPN